MTTKLPIIKILKIEFLKITWLSMKPVKAIVYVHDPQKGILFTILPIPSDEDIFYLLTEDSNGNVNHEGKYSWFDVIEIIKEF